MNTERTEARWIIRARHCLIAGEVAKAKGDIYTYSQWEARFEDAWAELSIFVRRNEQRYISLPAKRMIEREGLLAHNGRYNLRG